MTFIKLKRGYKQNNLSLYVFASLIVITSLVPLHKMTEQRLETDCAKLLKMREDIYWHRFYHVMGLYTSVPGDFFAQSQRSNYLIECKQCKGTRFDFERLTQFPKLKKFDSFKLENNSYVIISFLRDPFKDSIYFVLHVSEIQSIIDSTHKKSINLKELQSLYKGKRYEDILFFVK